jgi:DNA-directed RNA polymerase specialized sigma24 family protein
MADDPRDPPDDGDDPPEEPDVPVEGDDPAAPPLDAAIVRRFLNSQRALDIAKVPIRKIVPRGQVDDLAADAIVRALKARPPHLEIVLPAWLMTIAERRALRWLEMRTRRKKYEGPMPTHVAREDDYTGEAVETEDPAETAYDPDADEEPAELLGDHLRRLVGDHVRDAEVLAMVHEHSEEGKTYAEIAAARGLTPAQVANRILRFKAKYGARVKRRRQLLAVLWAVGAGLLAATLIALAWYLLHRRPEDIGPDPSRSVPSAAPSASASAPLFLQALPPGPEPSTEPEKPRPLPPP